MAERRHTCARIAYLSLVLATLLSLALACGTEERASTVRTPQAPRATQSPRATVVPPTPAPTSIPAATPTELPAPLPQPQWTIRQELSQGTLYVLLEDGLGPEAHVVAAAEPELVAGEQWEIDFVADTDGDGREEAIVLHYTGGAHCCFEYLVFDTGPDGIVLQDRFSLGNAGIEDIQDLDGDNVPELLTYDDRFAYFADLPYAASPFLRLVLCRSADGIYRDCTPEFPGFLEESADLYEGLLQESVQRQSGEEEQHSAALGLYASYLRLGMPAEGGARVTTLCPECWQWLTANAAEIDERLTSEQPWRD